MADCVTVAAVDHPKETIALEFFLRGLYLGVAIYGLPPIPGEQFRMTDIADLERRVIALEAAQVDNTKTLHWVVGTLGRVAADLSGVAKDVAVLKTDVADLKIDVAELKTDVAELKIDVADLKKDMGAVKADLSGLRRDLPSIVADAMREVMRP